MFYIKKYVDENRGVEYIRAEDIFDNRFSHPRISR